MSDMLCKDIDMICHQAALGSVPRSIERPVYTYHFNVMGFLTLCESARKAGIKRIVYASSSSVYGDDPRLPKKEDIVGNPLSPYATSKSNNEQVAQVYNTLHDMECIGLRYFNVFGPRQDPKGAYAAVIPKFIDNINNGKQCIINGDGNNSRDFTYVSNVVKANILALTADFNKSAKQIYNIAAGNRTSINDLHHKLSSIMSNKIEPYHGSPRSGDVLHSYADITLAQNNLNYQPEINIDDGLVHTVNYFIK
jgi:UDP-N-acetylglucosamine 4-epimerase